MLEPTKDSVPAVFSPRHTVVTGQAPPGPPNIPDPSTESMQVIETELDLLHLYNITVQDTRG